MLTAPIFHRPSGRLRSLVKRPGGMSAEQAVAAASVSVDEIRSSTLGKIDETLLKIREIVASTVIFDPSRAALLYGLSNQILGLAGPLNLIAMADAAYRFCALLDQIQVNEAWDADGVAVHLAALQALRNHPPGRAGDAAAQILDGLRSVVARQQAPLGAEQTRV